MATPGHLLGEGVNTCEFTDLVTLRGPAPLDSIVLRGPVPPELGDCELVSR